MNPFNNTWLMTPEILLAALGVILLLVALFTESPEQTLNRAVPAITVVGLLIVLGAILWVARDVQALSGTSLDVDKGGHLRVDIMSLFFKGVAVATTLIVTLMAVEYSKRFSSPGEFFSLIVLTTLAVSLLTSAADLITIYLSMEFLSITSYAMAGYYRENPRSTEAALKYFLYGAINSALMLYGLSLLYGLSAQGGQPATTLLSGVVRGLSAEPLSPIALLAIIAVLAGFFFKVSAAPFHQWAPDTYQGAPTPFVAFLSVASKVAGLAVMTRLVATIFQVPSARADGYNLAGMTAFVLMLVSALSMFVGNLLAIQQKDIKRLLAYSGVAQIGYILVGVAAMQRGNVDNGLWAVLVYSITYLFMNLGAFGVVTAINNQLHSSDLESYSGLFRRSPFLAASMAVFMISLAGVPPAAGWFGKYYLFQAAMDESLGGVLFTLALLLVVNSVIAAYYYLYVIKKMYFDAPVSETPIRADGPLNLGIALTLVMTLLLGTVAINPFNRVIMEQARFRPDVPRVSSQPLPPR